MIRIFAALVFLCLGLAQPAHAQGQADVWVQIEAQPNLIKAQERARDYSDFLRDVNGFSLGSGWYAIALGPYTRAEANQQLLQLRRAGRIPRDSFIALGGDFGQRFWPVGAGARSPVSPVLGDTAAAPEPELEPEPQPADETPAEARRSEAELNRNEREELQIALQWAGYYQGRIDGAFGRGTRGSMAAWQEANGYEVTGILTTLQRTELFRQYNAVLEGLGLETVTDREAGIEILMPTAHVGFSRYEPPFAHYDSTSDLGARVLLISEPGDQDTLFGLYEIMQTLEIVPLEGPRERRADSFVLQGENSRIVSYTEARLRDGAIKGFTLIWPAGDEDRRTRLLDEMRASLSIFDGTLSPGLVSEDAQSVDLVAGLQIRRPLMSRTGFYIDRQGTVLTALEAVEGCGRITLDGDTDARIVAQDAGLGVAVLRPDAALAPMQVATFQTATPRLQAEVAAAGFAYEGLLSAPSLTYGTLADLKGLNGEDDLKRLDMAALPGVTGGPVLDSSGAVLGMLVPARAPEGVRLPDGVSFAAKAEALEAVLAEAGVTAQRGAGAEMSPEALTDFAARMTVLVSCWE